MDLAKRGWFILGTPFCCQGVPADLQDDLAALLQGFPQADPGDGAVELRIESYDGDVATLTGPDGERWELAKRDAPISSLIEYRLINEAIARARERYVLHAGAVEGPRGTCLIIGESGAGKTTLTLWLWSSGLRLVTDDLCPVAHGSLAPERFTRALHMDCVYPASLLARIPPRPASYPTDYYPFPDATAGAPPPVADLLVIERGPSPEGELSPLSQSEAAHHLLKAVIKSPSFEYGRALTDMIGLASRCRAHLLRSSTPEGAAATALTLLTRA